MSLNLNKIMIAGRLTADPEMKMTTSGKSVVNVQVAVNRYTKEGEKQEADFITVVAFEKRAEIICRHFAKGFPIYVEGQLQIRQWTDRDGQKRNSAEVIAQDIRFVESKAPAQAATAPQNPPVSDLAKWGQPTEPKKSETPHFEQISADEELPF